MKKQLTTLLILLGAATCAPPMPALADTLSFTAQDASSCWDDTQNDNLPGLRWACGGTGNVYLHLPLPTLYTATTYDVSVWVRKNATSQIVSCRALSWGLSATYGVTNFVYPQGISPNAQELHLDLDVPAHGSVVIWCRVDQNAHVVAVDYTPAG